LKRICFEIEDFERSQRQNSGMRTGVYGKAGSLIEKLLLSA
jgi:hypothetical protein